METIVEILAKANKPNGLVVLTEIVVVFGYDRNQGE
jgi:hypothetical protein